LVSSVVLHVVFFFQAEDGIRDRNVTGVQTCALPISELMCAKESDDAVQQRALHAFRYIAERHRSHNVILVGHGALFRLGLSAALGYDHPYILNGDICEYSAELFRNL